MSNLRDALGGLRMIREWLEQRYVGAMPSEEAALLLYGPEPHHEAEAIIDALEKVTLRA